MPSRFVQWPLAKTYPVSKKGMVASKHPLASQAGIEVLHKGGNAVDSAIATSFALGVVEPFMSGVGGGGLALYQPKDQPPKAFHFGMRAPLSAHPDMYHVIPGTMDADLFGWPRTIGDENLHGPASIAVPGQVAGLHRLWEIGGRLPWRVLVEPAMKYAAEGIDVDWLLSLRTLEGYELLQRFPTSQSVFLPQGRPPKADLGLGAEVLHQPGLAGALSQIADDPAAVGKGELAQSIVQATNGRITQEELSGYHPLEAAPLSISFGGLEVHLVPWATGGATVLEWLGILRELDPPADEGSLDFWFAVVSAGMVAMSDRLSLFADPDFASFPYQVLEPSYHRQKAHAIRVGEIEPLLMPPAVGSTSHLAVVDTEENAITVTQSLLSLWGSGVVTSRTGICLNNGMMWFDPQPGRPNSIEPGKLPLANMSPVLVTKDDKPFLAYGASGGRRIVPAVVQILLRVALLGHSLADAIAGPRLEITNREIRADPRFGEEFCHQLAERLHHPVVLRNPILGSSPWASPVGLMRLEDGNWTGGADPYTNACVFEA
jgi:gamma-glutamyltranspeptidase / glutathione hydrolase